MSKHGSKGYIDGREGRKSDKPHSEWENLITNQEGTKRNNRENREYRDAYEEGKKDRERK